MRLLSFHTGWICFLSLFVFPAISAHAQLQADFSVNKQDGCEPLSVSFQDQSSGNISNYDWSFGNGNNSTKKNPDATYVSAGSYDVTLIVSNGRQADTITKSGFIQVFEPPQSGFQATPKQGCLPLGVRFQEDVTLADAPIREYIWDFGDGGSSNQTNPSHTYKQQGTFSVSLIVKDTNGCENVETKQNLIATSQSPNANFTATNNNGCETPKVVRFSNNSTGRRPLSHQWDFGDGNTDTAANPNHAYQQQGDYDVELIVTNARGCSDTVRKQSLVTIEPLNADFSLNQNEGCTNPLTTFRFTNQSTPSPTSHNWQFGDGSSSGNPNPNHQYISKGVYPITYIAGFGGCRDTARDTVSVQQISASIDADTFNSCRAPLEVNFSSQTSNVSQLTWTFDDGNSSNQANPTHTYTDTGVYNVRFDAQSPAGCKLTRQNIQITMAEPIVDNSFTPTTRKGCQSVTWDFTDQSVIPAFESVVERKWVFGKFDSSQAENPSVQFPDTGKFEVSHAIKTSGGCTDTLNRTFLIGDTPTYDISVDTTTFCAFEEISFNSNTNFADSSFVSFGDDSTFFDPLDEDPSHQYRDTGWFQVKAQAFFKGCPSKKQVTDSFFILPPVADFISSVNCDSPFRRSFGDNSISPDTWQWRFGDGTTSQKQNPVHRYDTQQRFNVRLVVKNDSTQCKDTITKGVFIEKIKARFSVSDSAGCPPLQNVRFDASASENVFVDNYFWNFKNGNILNKVNPPSSGSLIQPPPQTYKRSDTFFVRLSVRDRNLCRDTALRRVEVYPHDVNINTKRLNSCVPSTIAFSSQINVDTTLTQKRWTFGDGSPAVQGDTPTHTYTQEGSFQARLETRDAFGCSETTTFNVGVTTPQVFFQAFKTKLCRGEDVQLQAQRNAQPLDYKWSFGNGDSATGKNVTQSYANNGKYDVSLIGTDTNQCSDTLTRNDYLEVRSPNAAFTLNDTFDFCPPFVAKFSDSSQGQNLDYSWQFGDGGFSVLEAPQHTYTTVDTFKAKLKVTNDLGCTNKDSQVLVLDGPSARFNTIPDSGCKPLEYRFRAFDKRGVDEIRWDFGDGSTGVGDTVKHSYTRGGTYFPVIIIDNGKSDSKSCEYGIELPDTIPVDTHRTQFKPSQPSFCIYETVSLDNQTKGTIKAYEWQSITTGAIDSGMNPDFNFDSVSTYDLRLITTNFRGCRDSARRQFPVHPKPQVNAEDSTFICEDEQAQLTATFSADFEYQWSPEAGLSNPQQWNPLASPEETTTYRARVIDSNGCRDTSEAVQVEVQPRPQPKATPDTTIIKGDSVQLKGKVQVPIDSFDWTPTDSLRCTNCQNPLARPFREQTYTFTVQDTAGCFVEQDQVTIQVDERFKIAVPEAFTPNGDAINEIIKVRGWGVKELINFQVYNRWGELVFETRDLEKGWDGRYKGEPLPAGTYTYQIKARSYTGKVGADKGHFNLIR